MFCLRCGQQQATDTLRFCARCGFPLEGAMHLLAHGGMLPTYQPTSGEKVSSPKRRGVKQGAMLFLLGVLLVPILGTFASFGPGRIGLMFEFFTAVTALLCFLGGPLRMLFAAIFEEGAPAPQYVPHAYATPVLPPAARVSALPPKPAMPTTPWNPRPQTAEIAQPPSVTDHTTQLLNRSEPETK